MGKKYLTLNDIEAYKISFHLSNYTWNIVVKWDFFSRDTVGRQFVRSVDSISANIAEGFGRYSKKDKIKFYRYSFGSLHESFDWNQKSKVRGLLKEEKYQSVFSELQKLPQSIHHLINFTNDKLKI
ncbi:MAG: four helix bundle protein [Bacteroidetes bacterium]|nr:four helix bundle protein [Bacteroidota bacterium]